MQDSKLDLLLFLNGKKAGYRVSSMQKIKGENLNWHKYCFSTFHLNSNPSKQVIRMNAKNALLEPYLNNAKVEIFGSLVEEAMKQYFPAPPPNSLEPKEVWEQKKRNELMDLFSGQAAIDKSIAGFDAIVQDLNGHLSQANIERISQEWEHGVEAWIAKSLLKDKERKTPPESLMEILEISEETLNEFYQAANRYFKHKDFQKASDAFYIIAGLDPRRYNVWISLGLSEAHNHRFESALISFSMASIIDANSPDPYLFSAECCLRDRQIEEAKIYLELAEEAVNNSTLKDKQSLQNSIQNLKQQCK